MCGVRGAVLYRMVFRSLREREREKGRREAFRPLLVAQIDPCGGAGEGHTDRRVVKGSHLERDR